jgi:cytochrome c553
MKRIIAVLLVTFAVMVIVPVAMADNGPEVITIDKVQKSFPPVEFKHQEHQKRAGDCKTCHHKTEEGQAPKACSECHGVDEAAPSFKDAMHKTCKDCHKKMAAEGKTPPTKCPACHVKK